MKPYYQDDAVTIYHGDCRDVISDIETVHVVLTDPPFGIEGGVGLGAARGKGNYLGKDWEDTPAYIAEIVVPILALLIDTVPCVVVTPGARNMMLYPQPGSFGAFYQPAAVGMQSFGTMDASPILYYGRNQSVERNRTLGIPCSYVLTEAPEQNGHPCPKPLRAWKKLLANVSGPTSVTLDPFMGSGTTLRAAKDLGRKAIGIEIEERYCEIAAKRMAQTVMDLA